MTDNYRVQLPVFEGPLDLLLRLIEREELDITRISLAQVADQYLAHLAQLEQAQPDMLADFLVIAAKLILIKSQALLPRPPSTGGDGEKDVGDELVEQLRLYRQFKSAAAQLRERQEKGLRTYVRIAPPPKIDTRLDLSDVTLEDLFTAVREALTVTAPASSVDDIVAQRHITVRGQMDLIRRQLVSHGRLVFQEMLARASSRVEIAVTLLATLELVKLQEVTMHQEELFGAIVIIAHKPTLDKPT